MIMRFLAIGGLLAALGLSVALGASKSSNALLRAENAALEGKLGTCSARVKNLIEKRKSDALVDDLDDLGDFVLPDHWMREAD